MNINTSPLFKSGGKRAVQYQEANHELTSAYDEGNGFDTGRHNISMSVQENPIVNSLYSGWYRIYIRENVYKRTGETFHVFIDKPRWLIDMQLTEIKRLNKEESVLAAQFKNGLGGDKKLTL